MLCTCLRGKTPCPEQATHWALFRNKIREGWEIETKRVMCAEHAQKHGPMAVSVTPIDGKDKR